MGAHRQVKSYRAPSHVNLDNLLAMTFSRHGATGLQLKPQMESSSSRRERLAVLEAALHQQRLRNPEDSPFVQFLYREHLGDRQAFSDAARSILHTQYHAIPKSTGGIGW